MFVAYLDVRMLEEVTFQAVCVAFGNHIPELQGVEGPLSTSYTANTRTVIFKLCSEELLGAKLTQGKCSPSGQHAKEPCMTAVEDQHQEAALLEGRLLTRSLVFLYNMSAQQKDEGAF